MKSPITKEELQTLVVELKGDDFSLAHVMKSLGLEYDPGDVFDDLMESGLIDMCEECGVWDSRGHFEDGLCMDCYDEMFTEDDDWDGDDEDEEFLIGFADDDFDEDDDVLDEDYDDYYFDETDDEDDL